MVQINKRYWWLSDTSSIVYDWQFPYWERMDLSSLEYITPNPDTSLVQSFGTAYSHAILDCCDWTDSDEIYMFWYNWTSAYVKYKDNTTVISWACATTTIVPVIYNSNVIYITNQSKQLTLNKIWLSDVSGNTAWGWQASQSTGWKTGNTTSYVTNDIPALVWNNVLLVWYGRSLWRLNASDTREELIDDMNDDIVWLTSANTFVRIYLRNWQVLTYDWASSNVDYTTNLEVGRTVNVFWVRGTDYVITDTEQLLVSNWLDYQKLKAVKNYANIDWTTTKFSFKWDPATYWQRVMVEYKGSIYWVTKWSITSRGTLENWLPTAFNKEIVQTYDDWSGWYQIQKIYALSKSRDGKTLYMVYHYSDWAYDSYRLYSYKKDKDTSAWSLAQIYSPKILFGRTKRLWWELYIRADVSATKYITVYYKIDWGSWTERATINDDTRNTHILNNSLECNELELWFKFTGGAKMREYDFNQLPIEREWQT